MIGLDHSVVLAVVLVVEDEVLLRMRAVDMVEDAGYTSVEAVDADEAVAILESRSGIALIFTDIQMPGGMDGLKLAHVVHERWPPIKIIVVSGQLKLPNIDVPPRQPVFRQAARCQGSDRPDANHDRLRLMRALFALTTAIIARLRQKLRCQRCVRHPSYGDRVGYV
jgi:CheY-like chemotaxis protein